MGSGPHACRYIARTSHAFASFLDLVFYLDLFPDLWNFFIETATANDTFVAGGSGSCHFVSCALLTRAPGVDGAGYVYVPELGPNARAYEQRAAKYLSMYNVGVVDVGIANIDYPATTLRQVRANRPARPLSPLGHIALFSYKSTEIQLVPLYQLSSMHAVAHGASVSSSGSTTALPSSTQCAQGQTVPPIFCSITVIRSTSLPPRLILLAASNGLQNSLPKMANRYFCWRSEGLASSEGLAISSSCCRIVWPRCPRAVLASLWWSEAMISVVWRVWHAICKCMSCRTMSDSCDIVFPLFTHQISKKMLFFVCSIGCEH
jgi:hypothetical protein